MSTVWPPRGIKIEFNERNPNVAMKKRLGYTFTLGGYGPNGSNDTYIWVVGEDRIIRPSTLTDWGEVGFTPDDAAWFEEKFSKEVSIESSTKVRAVIPQLDPEKEFEAYVVDFIGFGPNYATVPFLFIIEYSVLVRASEAENMEQIYFTPEEMAEGYFRHPVKTDLL